ncbi:MAG TPA: hypothetical protein ENI07_14240 [Desulfobacterales bacterium]|nr:hypothetical protein [Desulfobacterales bacterium]
MSMKWSCDLCGRFIADSGVKYDPIERPEVNKPFVISSYYEGKYIDDEAIGWSGPEDKIEFWACKKCTEAFMKGVRALAAEMGFSGCPKTAVPCILGADTQKDGLHVFFPNGDEDTV